MLRPVVTCLEHNFVSSPPCSLRRPLPLDIAGQRIVPPERVRVQVNFLVEISLRAFGVSKASSIISGATSAGQKFKFSDGILDRTGNRSSNRVHHAKTDRTTQDHRQRLDQSGCSTLLPTRTWPEKPDCSNRVRKPMKAT